METQNTPQSQTGVLTLEQTKEIIAKYGIKYPDEKTSPPSSPLVAGEQMAGEGEIPNNYKGKTAEQVWNGWTIEQKTHFLKDHNLNALNYRLSFDALDPHVLERLQNHISETLYVKGGSMATGGGIGDFKFENGEIVWDDGNKSYGIVLNNYDNKDSEIRLDSDGNQPKEHLHKLGSKGDKGTKEKLQEALKSHKTLVDKWGYERVAYSHGGSMATGGEIYNHAEFLWNQSISFNKRIWLKENGFDENLGTGKSFAELPADVKNKLLAFVKSLLHRRRQKSPGGSMETGGGVDDRMYNFLKDDLKKLEKAVSENNKEEIDRFFSYWGYHLKSLENKGFSKEYDRMYNFLKDDLKKLEKAVSEGDNEEVERFFSYWGYHLKSLKIAQGGSMAIGGGGKFGMKGSILDTLEDAEYIFDPNELSAYFRSKEGYHEYNNIKKLIDENKLEEAVSILQKHIKISKGGSMAKGGEVGKITTLWISNDFPLSSQLEKITGDQWNTQNYESVDGGELTSDKPFRHKKTGQMFVAEKMPINPMGYLHTPGWKQGGPVHPNRTQRIKELSARIKVYEDALGTGILQGDVKTGMETELAKLKTKLLNLSPSSEKIKRIRAGLSIEIPSSRKKELFRKMLKQKIRAKAKTLGDTTKIFANSKVQLEKIKTLYAEIEKKEN